MGLPFYFYIGVAVIFLSLGYIIWLMREEKKGNSPSSEEAHLSLNQKKKADDISAETILQRVGLNEQPPDVPIEPPARPAKKLFSFLEKLPLGKKKPTAGSPQEIRSSLLEKIKALGKKNPPADGGTASLRLDQLGGEPQPIPSVGPLKKSVPIETKKTDDSASTEAELAFKFDELKSQHQELQQKYEKLETLFQEKSQELEHTKTELESELKNRKEFNKLKDLLEKEVRDTKDKVKAAHARESQAETEAISLQKRIEQLELRLSKTEKEILEKEKALNAAAMDIQKERGHAADLEEKLKKKDEVIEEKNERINQMVASFQTGASPASEEAASLPTMPPVPKPIEEPPLSPEAVPEEPVQETEPPPQPFSTQKEGGEGVISPEEAGNIPNISIEIVPQETTATPGPETHDEPPTLAPDIFADPQVPQVEKIEPPKNPEPAKKDITPDTEITPGHKDTQSKDEKPE